MKEEFKKWLCEKASTGCYVNELGVLVNLDGFSADENEVLATLIKAMWAINRDDSIFEIFMPETDKYTASVFENNNWHDVDFFFSDHNNSEQTALEKALEYVFEQEQS
jgi:hypothetical protein